jgi:hypothetical protein
VTYGQASIIAGLTALGAVVAVRYGFLPLRPAAIGALVISGTAFGAATITTVENKALSVGAIGLFGPYALLFQQ